MWIHLTLDDIVKIIDGANIQGITDQHITNLSSLDKARKGSLSFLTNPKYSKSVSYSQATAILLPKDFIGSPKRNQVFLHVENPSLSLAHICEYIEQTFNPTPEPGIHPTAIIHPTATISDEASIGAFCTIAAEAEIDSGTVIEDKTSIGKKVRIGKDCRIRSNVSLSDYTVIENRVYLSSGVVIGADGFGYSTTSDGKHHKEPQIGRVFIEDDVEIGANSTVDCARIDETRIGAGTKIDNLVQIGHNVIIGRNCLIAAQVGIAGSVILEDNVVIGGQAGIGGHITIGRGARITGKAGVSKNVPAEETFRGNPAAHIHYQNRILASQRKLPDLLKRVAKIETLLHSIIYK